MVVLRLSIKTPNGGCVGDGGWRWGGNLQAFYKIPEQLSNSLE